MASTRLSTPTERRDQPLALLAAGVTVVLWASAFVGIRAAGEQLSPGPLSLARLLIGAGSLALFVAIRRDAHEDGAWVREAASAHAAKQALREAA